MSNRRAIPGLLVLWSLCAPVGAQILPPVPPAEAPSKAFEPPPQPPPTPTPPPRPEPGPADQEKAVPSLIDRDDAGRLKPHTAAIEEVLLSRMEFNDEERAKIAAWRDRRRAEVERMVIQKLDVVLEAREMARTAGSITDPAGMARVKEISTALALPKAMESLLREGVISPMLRSKMDQAIREYDNAMMQQHTADIGENVSRIIQIVAGQSFNQATREPFAALDGLVVKAAASIEKIGAEASLSPAAAKSFEALKAELARPATGDEAQQSARRVALVRPFFFDSLAQEEQRAVLRAVGPE